MYLNFEKTIPIWFFLDNFWLVGIIVDKKFRTEQFKFS